MNREQVTRVRTVIYRGGTSKGLFLHENDLPQDPKIRDKVILAMFGSPDPRQIDGLGGAEVLTSKLAIIGPPSVPGADVDYTFGQVSIDKAYISYSGLSPESGSTTKTPSRFSSPRSLSRTARPLSRAIMWCPASQAPAPS